MGPKLFHLNYERDDSERNFKDETSINNLFAHKVLNIMRVPSDLNK